MSGKIIKYYIPFVKRPLEMNHKYIIMGNLVRSQIMLTPWYIISEVDFAGVLAATALWNLVHYAFVAEATVSPKSLKTKEYKI